MKNEKQQSPPAAAKESFVLYLSWYETLKSLDNESLGKLFRAIFTYQKNFELPDLEPELRMAFGFMKNQFDKDREKYLKRCEANRKAIQKRWESES